MSQRSAVAGDGVVRPWAMPFGARVFGTFRRDGRLEPRLHVGESIGMRTKLPQALFVVAVVGFWLAGSSREPGTGTDGSRLRTGNKSAALAGPLYRSGPLSRVPCRLPKIAEGDESAMQTFLETLSNCLDAAWNRQFTKAGVKGFTAPQRIFWSTPGSSPCGSYPAPGASAWEVPPPSCTRR